MDEANYAKCSCPSCLNHVAFPANLLGTVIDCPHCARPFKLELATSLSQPAAGLDLPALEAAFQGKVEPRETTARYKLAVALVAAVMVLMVLLYLAIVAGAAGALVWHATQHVSLVSGPRSGGFIRELQATRLDSYVRTRIEVAAANKRSGLFDSHPSDAERLHFARAAASPGLVRLPGPATQLLSNFPALAAYYTSLHYTELLCPKTEINPPGRLGRPQTSLR